MNLRSTIARLWGTPQAGNAKAKTGSVIPETAAKAIRWGVSEMGLLLTTDGKDCPGCDAPGSLCRGTMTGIFVPEGLNVDDLMREVEQIFGPSNAFGKVDHGEFYLDPAHIKACSAPEVIQLLTAVGNALTGLGYKADLSAGLSTANRVLAN
jgi:hypothetical protein